MKLYDILAFLAENTNVVVYDTEGNPLAIYDGRNSIPVNLNERTVLQISVMDNYLEIVIEEV